MNTIVQNNYKTVKLILYTAITTFIIVSLDLILIDNNIIVKYFGISTYIFYTGIASCISLLVITSSPFNKQDLTNFFLNIVKWLFSLFLISGTVNEFKFINPGGIIGNFYQSSLYEIFPYYSIIFFITLVLYGYILNFPFITLFNFVSELIGDKVITTFYNLNNILLNLPKPSIELTFNKPEKLTNIKSSPDISVKKLTNIKSSPDISVKKLTNIKRSPDISVKKLTNNDLFNKFEETINNNELDITNKLDEIPSSESDNKIVRLLNTAFKHMKLMGIQVLDKILPGPIVTTYELKLPDSMEVSKLDNEKKLKDLTRRLKVKTIRVKYNEGGTDHVFLEVPNQKADVVKFEDNMKKMIPEMVKQKLPLFVGVNTGGIPRTFDLADFPHMLVAGSTGSGKTVGIHGMLSSLMTVKKEDHVQLVMIDPKLMEFVHYGNSPYLINVEEIDGEYQEIDDIAAPLIQKMRDKIECTVTEVVDNDESGDCEIVHGYDEFQVTDGIVCDMEIVPEILSKLVFTMQVRLLRLKAMRASNLTEFNEKVKKSNGIHTDKNGVEREVKKMPYIVVVIDEFADLIEEYGAEVEGLVKRLAQKARAAGIHLILCTQRPSVDVISGVIKANMPVRLSYRLATAIDAKTIGVKDAEKLLGRGDCIIHTNTETTRLHGPFIKTSKVSKLAKANI